MSMDPNAPYQSPGMQPGAPQKGGGSKVLLGLGIGCGIMLLLCCGIGGYGVYMFKNTFKFETTPAGVTAMAEEITDMEPPESFTPAVGMSMTNPMTGQKIFTMATYAGPNQKGMLVVVEFDQTMAGANAEQMKSQMENSMQQQQQQNRQGFQQLEMVGEPRDVETTVRGQEATFKIQTGKSPDGEEYYQVQGVFQGKGGPGFLMGQFPAEQVDEEQTEAFVRSIK